MSENKKLNVKTSDIEMKRKNEIYNLIKSQTNYLDDEISEKLEKWNNDYIKVIKEYLNPNFEKKKQEKKKSTNQQIMTEIRHFLNNIKN